MPRSTSLSPLDRTSLADRSQQRPPVEPAWDAIPDKGLDEVDRDSIQTWRTTRG
jgi:hypothetical protein